MKHQNRSSYIFLLILGATIIGGIWIFGLDDELFGSSDYAQYFARSYNEDKFFSEDHIASDKQEIAITEKEDTQNSEPVIISEKPVNLQQYDEPKSLKKLQTKDTKEDMIKDLENRVFVLQGNGQGFMATPVNSKTVLIYMELTPIPDSKFTKFQIKTGKFYYDGNPINMEDGLLEINNNTMTLILSQDNNFDQSGTISGTFNYPALDFITDKKSKEYQIHFNNQVINLGTKSNLPIQFTVDLMFSHL